MLNWQAALHWSPDRHWQRVVTLDAHTGGEPLRIFLSDFPTGDDNRILSRRRFAREHVDYLRTATMWEPRGHADMYGCVVTPPEKSDGHFGVLFLHNEGYSSMCGHGIIAVMTALFETGVLPDSLLDTPINIDAPAGRIVATAHREQGRIGRVSFLNVPSYVVAQDARVDVPGLGGLRYDLVFGGAYYAYVNASDLGLRLLDSEFRAIIDCGVRIKQAVMNSTCITHPEHADLSFLYGTIFVAPALNAAHHSRNVCVFADGEVDRSPTGTGVAGRCALAYARQEIRCGDVMRIESIVGSTLDVRAMREIHVGDFNGVVPEVSGRAHLTGRNEFWLDPDDPFVHGFLLR